MMYAQYSFYRKSLTSMVSLINHTECIDLVEQLEPRLDDVCGVDEEGGEGPCEASRDEGPVEDGLRGARLLARTQRVEVGEEREVAHGEHNVPQHGGAGALK